MEIGEKIKSIRASNNLSQEEFAELFHVTRQAVSNWEHNRNYPDMGTLGRLSDRFNISFDELVKGDEELIDKIDKSRANAGMWKKLFIILSAIVLVLAIVYAVPRVMKALFYNPEDVVAVQQYSDGVVEEHRMDVDMQVFSELRIPGHRSDSVSCYGRGMGCYDITINQSTYVGNGAKSVSGSIERGHLQLYDPNVFTVPYGNVFEWSTGARDIHKSLKENLTDDQKKWINDPESDDYTLPETQGIAGTTKESKAALKNLDPNKYYESYISFNNALGYPEILKWLDTYGETEILYPWVAVATGEDIQKGPIGFYPYFSGYIRAFDKDKYPFLFGYEDAGNYDGGDELRNESNAGQHLLSMLKYMQDQEDFRKMMSEVGFDANFSDFDLERTIEYIEKNGLHIYGVSVTAKKATLIRLHEDGEVFSISTEVYNN